MIYFLFEKSYLSLDDVFLLSNGINHRQMVTPQLKYSMDKLKPIFSHQDNDYLYG